MEAEKEEERVEAEKMEESESWSGRKVKRKAGKEKENLYGWEGDCFG